MKCDISVRVYLITYTRVLIAYDLLHLLDSSLGERIFPKRLLPNTGKLGYLSDVNVKTALSPQLF